MKRELKDAIPTAISGTAGAIARPIPMKRELKGHMHPVVKLIVALLQGPSR